MAISSEKTSSIFLPPDDSNRYFLPDSNTLINPIEKEDNYQGLTDLLQRFWTPQLPKKILDCSVTLFVQILPNIENGFSQGKIPADLCQRVVRVFLKNQCLQNSSIPETVEFICQDNTSVSFNKSLLVLSSKFFNANKNWGEITSVRIDDHPQEVILYFKEWLYGKSDPAGSMPLSFYLQLYILSDFLLHPSFGAETSFEELVFQKIQSTEDPNMTEEELLQFLKVFLGIEPTAQKKMIEDKLLKMLLNLGKVKYEVINHRVWCLPPDQLYLLHPKKPSVLADAFKNRLIGILLTSQEDDINTLGFIKPAIATILESVHTITLPAITTHYVIALRSEYIQPFNRIRHIALPVVQPQEFQKEFPANSKTSHVVLNTSCLRAQLEAISLVLDEKMLKNIEVTLQIFDTRHDVNKIFLYGFTNELEILLKEYNVRFLIKNNGGKIIDDYTWVGVPNPGKKEPEKGFLPIRLVGGNRWNVAEEIYVDLDRVTYFIGLTSNYSDLLLQKDPYFKLMFPFWKF